MNKRGLLDLLVEEGRIVASNDKWEAGVVILSNFTDLAVDAEEADS